MRNNNLTNNLIKWSVIATDFVILWTLLYVFTHIVNVIPSFIKWDDDKEMMFWMINTMAMVAAEYFFSTRIHLRNIGIDTILRRSTLLTITQAVTSYLLLRSIHFTSKVGVPLIMISAILLMTIILSRFLERWLLKKLRRMGYNTRSVTLVGDDKELHLIHREMEQNASWGYRINAYYGSNESRNCKGSTEDFVRLLETPDELQLGNELYLCISRKEKDVIERTAQLCTQRMVKFYYVPVSTELLNLEPTLFGEHQVFSTYVSPLEDPLNKVIKRFFDIILSIIFLIPCAIIFPVVACIIKKQSPGPVFFRQRRTGLVGHDFYCYKFRSMHVNNDADRVQATEDDPRKFAFGNFMRKTNIDELPQFWNVLRGDMSIVGPRPHMLSHTEQYSHLIDKYMVRHFVKPGVTGWAQVTGFRGETKYQWQMEGRVERDIWYIQHWSIWLDLRIIWMTVKSIFVHDKNAY